MTHIRPNQLFLLLALVAVATMIACKKNAEEDLALLTASEATEIVETTVSARSAGATMSTADLTKAVENNLNNCGIPGDTSLQHSNSAGQITYNYNIALGWLINCNNIGVPQNADLTIAGNGSFNAQRWTGVNSTSGNLVCTGLNPAASEYIFNGAYALNGNLTGQIRNIDPMLEVEASIQLTNLTIRKSDNYITGGSGTVVITATNARGRSETINGTLVFNGNATATVTVNGYSHTFPLK